MKTLRLSLLLLVFFVLALGSCIKKDMLAKRAPNLPAAPYQYVVASLAVVIPPGNPYLNNSDSTLDNTPACNPVTNAGATLGRVLFYENLFSLNNSISCGSCHKQQNAFGDNTPVSTGYNGQLGTRNAIALSNEEVNSNFFWDGRVNTLESQSIMPLQNHAEMGMENLDNLVIKLQSAAYYPPLFKAAFGSPEITKQGIAYALAQFMRSMHTFGSKFDQGAASGFTNFTEQEKDGELVFRTAGCQNCHGGNNLNNGGLGMDHDMPSGNDWANDGLDVGFPDAGLKDVTGRETDKGVFKIPSLRNVGLTAPYMHDGRFQTLAQVVEHYNSGLQANPNLDFRLMQGFSNNPGIFVSPPAGSGSGTPMQLHLTTQQESDLVSFLNTLTDYEFVNDPKFSDPFK